MTDEPTDDAIELEADLDVPIPGRVLPESEWARTAIKRLPPPEDGPLDWPAIFGREAPLVLDIGCGNGRFTLLSALNRPDHDHVAVDLLPAVVRYATKRANQRGLHNVRVVVRDAESFVRHYVAPGLAAEVHLYHPQPYRDPRQSHLRLVTPGFLADVHRVLAPGGLFVVQTDNPAYWDYIRRVVPAFFNFTEHPEPWPDAPEGRTRRELMARRRGLTIFRGSGRRRDDIDPAEARSLAESLPPPEFGARGPWSELDELDAPGPRRPASRRPRGRGPRRGR